MQGLASNLGSIPARGEYAFTFTGRPNQNLQFSTANPVITHLFHLHFSIQPTDMEASRTVGWSTSPGVSIKFGIILRPW